MPDVTISTVITGDASNALAAIAQVSEALAQLQGSGINLQGIDVEALTASLQKAAADVSAQAKIPSVVVPDTTAAEASLAEFRTAEAAKAFSLAPTVDTTKAEGALDALRSSVVTPLQIPVEVVPPGQTSPAESADEGLAGALVAGASSAALPAVTADVSGVKLQIESLAKEPVKLAVMADTASAAASVDAVASKAAAVAASTDEITGDLSQVFGVELLDKQAGQRTSAKADAIMALASGEPAPAPEASNSPPPPPVPPKKPPKGKSYDPSRGLSRLASGIFVARDLLRSTRGIQDYEVQMTAAGSNVRAQYNAEENLQRTVGGGMFGELANLIIDPAGTSRAAAKTTVDSADARDAQTKGNEVAFEQRRGFQQQAQLDETTDPFDRQRLQVGFNQEKELEAARAELKTQDEQAADVRTHERAEAVAKYNDRTFGIQTGDPDAFRDSADKTKTLSHADAMADAQNVLTRELDGADSAREESVRKNNAALNESTAAINAGAKAEAERIDLAQQNSQADATRRAADLGATAGEAGLQNAGMADEAAILEKQREDRGRLAKEQEALKVAEASHNLGNIITAESAVANTRQLNRAEEAGLADDQKRQRTVQSDQTNTSTADERAAAEQAVMESVGDSYDAATKKYEQGEKDKLAALQTRLDATKDAVERQNIETEIGVVKAAQPIEAAARQAGINRQGNIQLADMDSDINADEQKLAGDDAGARATQRRRRSERDAAAARANKGDPNAERKARDIETEAGYEQLIDDKQTNRSFSDLAAESIENRERSVGNNLQADTSQINREADYKKEQAGTDPTRLAEVETYRQNELAIARNKDSATAPLSGAKEIEAYLQEHANGTTATELAAQAAATNPTAPPAMPPGATPPPNIFGPGANQPAGNNTIPLTRTPQPNPMNSQFADAIAGRRTPLETAMGHPILDHAGETAMGHKIGTGDGISDWAKAQNAKKHEDELHPHVEPKPAPRRPDPALHGPGSSLDGHKKDDGPDSISQWKATHPKTPATDDPNDTRNWVPGGHRLPAEFMMGYTGPSPSSMSDHGGTGPTADFAKFDGTVGALEKVVERMETVFANTKELYVLG